MSDGDSAKPGLLIIADFLMWLEESRVHRGLFRGHASKSWELRPSALRPGVAGITEQRQLEQWKSGAARFVNPRPSSDIEWLILAQHHGIPTILLDWTTNPLIALFFACDGLAQSDEAGVVYRATFDLFEDCHEARRQHPFIDRADFPGLVNATAMNPRSMAQDSYMSIHTKVVPSLQRWENGIPRFQIAGGDKFEVIQALRMFGISDARLYVDIARVVKSVRAGLDFEYLFKSVKRDVLRVGESVSGPIDPVEQKEH